VTIATSMSYPFSEIEFDAAHKEWGCNCGPSALAFALQLSLDAARYAIRDFDQKRYTSPTMMKAALAELGRTYIAVRKPTSDDLFVARPALVRIQWTGPWTAPGAHHMQAYAHTHWIATWRDGPTIGAGVPFVFDCNGGARAFFSWRDEIVPLLLPEKGDGGWKPTHVWRIDDRKDES
tara:strand:- start:4218 stop:4751 length:534 start_codon:yes stop_codon:yes gene_type:complete